MSVGPGLRRQLETRLDDIGDVDENGRGALLAVLLDEQDEIVDVAGIHRLADGGGRRLVSDLVAADGLEADRLQDLDASTIQRIAGFQWIASRMPRAAEGVITS